LISQLRLWYWRTDSQALAPQLVDRYRSVSFTLRAGLYEQDRLDHLKQLQTSMIQLLKKREAKLLETSQTGSESQEFESLFSEYWAYVYRILNRLVGDPAEAEDLALETFLRLYHRNPLKEDGFQPGGWLYRVATNLGLRSIRSFKRRERYEIEAGRFALEEAPETRPAELHARAEQQDLARQALAKMNERQSQLLILRHSGLSYKEIAGSLGLAPTSIGPLLVRAEREFEECYRALAREET
jgi:RNA polymerase sigma factor (sigma-70 family)